MLFFLPLAAGLLFTLIGLLLRRATGAHAPRRLFWQKLTQGAGMAALALSALGLLLYLP